MRDLAFLSGQFFDTEIPKDKAYLQKYFTSNLQKAFLRYVLVFEEDVSAFCEHTGYVCTPPFLYKLRCRYKELISVHKKAKESMDFDLLWLIESGKFESKKTY